MHLEMPRHWLRVSFGKPTISTSAGFRQVYSVNADESSWRTPHLWLARHGLVIEQEWYVGVMPREVALVLRGGTLFERVTSVRPPLFAMAVDSSEVAWASTMRAASVVRAVERLISQWRSTPGRVLKRGVVDVRDLRRFCSAAALDPTAASVVVEVAGCAGLVAVDMEHKRALPGAACEVWLDKTPERQWEALVRAWLDTPTHPGRAGAGDSEDRPQLVRTEVANSIVAPEQRRLCLAALLEADPGTAVDEDSLYARLEWDAPMLWNQGPVKAATIVDWICRDAELLGLCCEGSLSKPGRRVARGEIDSSYVLGRPSDEEAMPGAIARRLLERCMPCCQPS